MTIVDIYKQIKNKKEEQKFSSCWKPTEAKAKDYGEVPQFSIPQKRKKKSTEKMISNTLAFVELVKYKRLRDAVTLMPISTNNKVYLKKFGNSMAISRLIEFMIDIGLISVANPNYRFNSRNPKNNKSREFYYFYDNEIALLAYCETNKISVSRECTSSASLFNRFEIGDFDREKVRFSSKLRLKKIDGYSKTEFEDLLRLTLYDNYPEFGQVQKMYEEINQNYYADQPNLQITFEPNFTWEKSNPVIKKIRIRATNSFCNAKKEKDGNPKFCGYYKQDVLDMFGLVFEKDVNSSVPRMTSSINAGKWVSENEDIYERIYNSYLKLKYPNGLPKDAVQFADARPAIKSLHMRCYFDYKGKIGPHIIRAMSSCNDKKAVNEEMKLLWQAIIDAEGGKLYDNEIFYYESVIYGRVLKQLLDEGFFVWMCYDAFYSTAKDNWTQEMFEEHVAALVEEHANKFIEEKKKAKKLNSERKGETL